MSTVRLTLDSPGDGQGECSACQKATKWSDVSILLYRPTIAEWDAICLDCSVTILQSAMSHFLLVEAVE